MFQDTHYLFALVSTRNSNSIKMKLLVIAALLAVASAATLKKREDAPEPVAILRSTSEVNPDGSYAFSFETADGVSRSESGAQKEIVQEDGTVSAGTVMKGSYSYTEADGTKITVNWVADENGFQPTGAHLPVAPPMPEHVVKLLADLRAAGKL